MINWGDVNDHLGHIKVGATKLTPVNKCTKQTKYFLEMGKLKVDKWESWSRRIKKVFYHCALALLAKID